MDISTSGPATQLIDGCFAGKLALCRQSDSALGFKGTEPWSFEGHLRFWYSIRRPGFVRWDALCGFQPVSN